MVDVTLLDEDARPWLRIMHGDQVVDIALDPSMAYRDVIKARDELASLVRGVRVPANQVQQDMTHHETDWAKKVTTCACGRKFPDTGLSGLGKHVNNCEEGRESLILADHAMTRIYRPVVEALYDLTPHRFTKKQALQALRSRNVDISESGLRGHLGWLVDQGILSKVTDGRQAHYRFTSQPPTTTKEVTNT